LSQCKRVIRFTRRGEAKLDKEFKL